jgi:uncharacterized membrane protein YjgN (DUF898 family)
MAVTLTVRDGDGMNPSTARFRYHGTGGSLFGLTIVNALLTLITFGIYSFWAKNKVREFHYGHTELEGDRFAYHGTGGELFAGALKVSVLMFVFLILFGISAAIAGGEVAGPAQLAIVPLFYLAIFCLMPIAINGARRYRLSRSSWRGIRFAYDGRWRDFLGLMIKGSLLTIVTLGFYAPYFQSHRRAFFVDNTRFGSEPFSYDGEGRELVPAYLKALLLTIPTLGLSWVWYAAFKHRYFWNHTTMRGARFRSNVTGGEMFGLHLTNALLALFTFGLAISWTMTRSHAFWCDKVTMRGTMDWASIEQRSQPASATGEGLLDALEMDVGIGA